MQKIWNTVYRKTIICTISTDSPVFAIVSIFIFCIFKCLFQAQQHVSDSWCSVISSTGLSVVNTFFGTNEELTTDESRRAFAKEGLKDLKFLYSNPDVAGPQVLLYLILCFLLLTHTPVIQGSFLWNYGSMHFCCSFHHHHWCCKGGQFEGRVTLRCPHPCCCSGRFLPSCHIWIILILQRPNQL